MKKVVVLGTGGTIAGRAQSGSDNVGYKAGEVGVGELLSAIPGIQDRLQGMQLLAEQVAQIDSKDMSWAVWGQLVQQCELHLADPDVAAVLVTHGTDTLEETAYLLHLALGAKALRKPVVLTCAMRPATALTPDGPQNVLDAITVALHPASQGVMVVCAGAVHAALHVQKRCSYRVDAFDSGDAGPLAWVEEGQVRWCHAPVLAGDESMQVAPANWPQAPRVDMVMNCVDAGAYVVDALLLSQQAGAPRLLGMVVAGTGNGTINEAMHHSLLRAVEQGVRVVLASRCTLGGVVRSANGNTPFAHYPGLSAVKARVRLMLELAA